ncbi:MAG: nitroreductase family protein [Candidatus Coatesbacteria bacterium]|nr:MAG: nitroreductase family protein [Candidatus Coatesbacteria bacterium]
MDLYEILMKRRSVRDFEDKEIPDEIIDKILDAALSAPTGGNIQPISIIVVRGEEAREKLDGILGNQPWVKRAPVSLIFCLDFHRAKRWASTFGTDFSGERAVWHFLIAYADVMCASQNAAVLAESLGLGSVYVGAILSKIDKTRNFFDIPEYVLPMMILSIGYPKTIPKNIPKLERDIMVHKEKYEWRTDEELRAAYENKYGDFDETAEDYLKRAYIEAIEADKQGNLGRVEYIKGQLDKLAIKSNAEFLFKVRYPSEAMVELNEEITGSFRKAGFNF